MKELRELGESTEVMLSASINSEEHNLAILSEIDGLLDTVSMIPDLKELHARADALQRYLRNYNAAWAVQFKAGCVRIKAERKIGHWLSIHGFAGKSPQCPGAMNIRQVEEEYGINPKRQSMYRLLARIPEKEVDAHLRWLKERTRIPSTQSFYRLAKRVCETYGPQRRKPRLDADMRIKEFTQTSIKLEIPEFSEIRIAVWCQNPKDAEQADLVRRVAEGICNRWNTRNKATY